jgi:murein DD-endopeptidase MepM/ murein hydrolase activator NlpD
MMRCAGAVALAAGLAIVLVLGPGSFPSPGAGPGRGLSGLAGAADAPPAPSGPDPGAGAEPAPGPGAGAEPAPAPGGGTACSPGTGYRPPVSAPVTDPFRAPAHPFGPGNRGLEYRSTPGSAVGAIGAGTVVFAGPVAGQLHVTVRHADGLRSTYSYLAEIAVGADEPVVRGQLVGRAGARLHLGVRCGTAYLDPAPLFARRGRARLVPDDRFPAPAPPTGRTEPPARE